MSKERRGHPANWLYEELFEIKDEDSDIWWNATISFIEQIRQLSDRRSVSGVCYLLHYHLKEWEEKHPADSERIKLTIDNEVIPLWERELNKNDNWMHIPDNAWEFATQVEGSKGREYIHDAAIRFKESLPSYRILELSYPDDGIANGIEAVMSNYDGNWYVYMMHLYKFCSLGADVAKIEKICKEKGWEEELAIWTEIKNYFYDILLNVDLVKMNPRFVEGIYEFLSEDNFTGEKRKFIDSNYNAWKFARFKIYGSVGTDYIH